jgi:hypothetical protein
MLAGCGWLVASGQSATEEAILDTINATLVSRSEEIMSAGAQEANETYMNDARRKSEA